MKSRILDNPENPGRRRATGVLMMGLGLACLAAPLLAEDPLLGTIRVIKCVGCSPGGVKLVVHDPIDVRDFEVRIKESDYQKIITPLAGKTIYDKDGCFYWMEQPKNQAARAAGPAPKKPADGPDSGAAGSGEPSVADSIASSAPEIAREAVEPEGTPSRCIPFEIVRAKASGAGDKRGKPEE